jgi:hypothetical protein
VGAAGGAVQVAVLMIIIIIIIIIMIMMMMMTNLPVDGWVWRGAPWSVFN